jgi:hypothetical protein
MFKNRLKLNCSKTVTMHFRTPKSRAIDFNIIIGGTKLQQVLSTKFLGVTFDSYLKWDTHIDLIAKKIYPVVTKLAHIRSKLTTSAMRLIYDSLVLPHISYCIVVWG